MKAAKEDPYYSKNFLYLGHYYLKTNHDFIKALKCYKKAFELDIYEEEAGIALTDILKEMKEDETNLQVLQKVVKQSPIGSAKWARFRLGLYYLHHENISLAIDTLQGALHCDPTDSQCWETIGEAYLLRGSYNSALKSFEKAVELNPSNLHSRYCVAQILLITGIYTDAIKEFQNILKIEPFYIAAFKGLAESFLYQAKYYLNECFFGRFKDCCRDAICILS
ncbi:tetratricopeptide repeat protein 37-like, partial [Centruroides sculpturatus]|uniref:tetratricopeptide repeat protein 37-like n=1 Tax=Centruroides sculpturatus TaxID=218467 RepID=UPI000C6EE939